VQPETEEPAKAAAEAANVDEIRISDDDDDDL